jgi:flagellar assembly factor FliW
MWIPLWPADKTHDAMPQCETKYFGTTEYEDSSILLFPAGLPGFESETRFLVLQQPAHDPLVFLQSLATPDLCFVAMPVRAIEPNFELDMAEQDLELLGLDPSLPPAIGEDLVCLAIVTIAETGITANLMAPVVINTPDLRAVQAISPGERYSHRHPVGGAQERVCS